MILQTERETVSFTGQPMPWSGDSPRFRVVHEAGREAVVRRALVNFFVAVTSLAVLAASWVGVGRADEGRRLREATERERQAFAGEPGGANAVSVADPPPAGPSAPTTVEPPPGVALAGASPVTTPTPQGTAVAGASASAPPPPSSTTSAPSPATPTPPAPGLIPAPSATKTVPPTVTATPAAPPTASPTASPTPRRIIRPSRAS